MMPAQTETFTLRAVQAMLASKARRMVMHPADELEFRRLTSMLPESGSMDTMSVAEMQAAWRTLRRMEEIIDQNRPNNPKRIMRDMARGRFPGC